MKVATAKQGWKGLRTLTVRELIEVLQEEDLEMPVVFRLRLWRLPPHAAGARDRGRCAGGAGP